MQTRRSHLLLILLLIFVASILVAAFSAEASLVKELASYPALLAIFGAIFAVLHDEVRNQREIGKHAALAVQNLFAGSHYGSSVYDKQIEFCQSYWSNVLKMIRELEREGESGALVQRANALYTHRMEHAIWLDEPTMIELEAFERVLRSTGAGSRHLESLDVGPKRTAKVEEVMRGFERIMSIDKADAEPRKPPSYLDVLEHLQAVLGISSACAVRQEFMNRAQASV